MANGEHDSEFQSLVNAAADLPFVVLRLDETRQVVSSDGSDPHPWEQALIGQRFDDAVKAGDRQAYSSYMAKLNMYTGGYLDVFVTLEIEGNHVMSRVRMKREERGSWFALIEEIDFHDPLHELLESREHHREVLRTASEGIAFLDAKSRIFEMNNRFREICEFRSADGTALDNDSIYGRQLAMVAGPDFYPIFAALANPSEHKRRYEGSIVTVGKHLQARLTPTFLNRFQLGGYVLTVLDLTTEEENRKLSKLSETLAAANDGLELAVEKRHAALQLVLDNTGDGILSVAPDGTLLSERSQATTKWFGEPSIGEHIWEYLTRDDKKMAQGLELAFDQMASNILPFHVAAEQAPRRLQRGNQAFSLQYRNVSNREGLDRIVVLIRDITSEIEAERAEQAAKDLHRLIANLLRDQEGYRQSIEEVTQLIEIAKSTTDIVTSKRVLHTIKGSCSVVGLRKVADYVHDLETRMTMDARLPRPDEIRNLEGIWHELLLSISDFLHTEQSNSISVEFDEYEDAKNLLEINAPHAEVLAIIERWPYEPTQKQLERLSNHANRVAGRLGKSIQVALQGGAVRIPTDRLKQFWPTLVHIIRNAIDHGCETVEERKSKGKPERCKLSLSTHLRDGVLEISIADDGRGIDWEKLKEKAEAEGMPHATRDDLVDALFSDGISTREEITDISGRGVGLAAVKDACQAAQGVLQVTTAKDQGTTFSFRFPIFVSEVSSPNDDSRVEPSLRIQPTNPN